MTASTSCSPTFGSMGVIFSIFTKNTECVAVFHTRFSISALIRCSLFSLILKNWRISKRTVQPGLIQTKMMDVRANNQPQFMLSHVDRTPAGTLHVRKWQYLRLLFLCYHHYKQRKSPLRPCAQVLTRRRVHWEFPIVHRNVCCCLAIKS